MTFLSVLLGFFATLAGGMIGIWRISLITVIGISGFLSYAASNAFHSTLTEAIEMFGIAHQNALIFSLCLLVMVPLFGGIFFGFRVIGFLGLRELGSTGYGQGSSAADKICGSGFALLIYLVLFALLNR